MPQSIIVGIIERNAEDAMFLWLQRGRAVYSSNYSLADLAALDDRLDAVIEGLKLSGEKGWRICLDALSLAGPEALFAPAVLAFASGRQEWIEEILAAGEKSAAHVRPLISALGWIESEQARPHIETLLASDNPTCHLIGIGAGAIKRMDMGARLTNYFSSPEPRVRARIFRMTGELGRKDYLRQLQGALKDSDESCRFWAAWSMSLLGDRNDSSTVLMDFAEDNGAYWEMAALTAARTLTPCSVQTVHKNMAGSKTAARLAVKLAGAYGDPVLMPWMIEQMGKPALARLAGDAFTMITGVNISSSNLEGAKPKGFQSGPTDDPDDPNVAMDPDRDLPWPNQEIIHDWWKKNGMTFDAKARYLNGRPINAGNLQQALITGNQKIRAAAALEKAIIEQGSPLFEVRASAWQQRQVLNKNGI